MRFKSLKTKLLLPVSALVIGSGLLISMLVSQRYSKSLLDTMAAQAENEAHAVALEATDKILINDLVALHTMLRNNMRSHPSIAYLFVQRDAQVLAHTFSKAVPVGLLKANIVTPGESIHFQRIASRSGEYYLDIAWPIFDGKAGVLRLGFSDTRYRQQMTGLWLRMSAVTLGILLLALGGTLLFVRRITRPLGALAQATEKIDKGELGIRVNVPGHDEVGKLAASFNHMVARMEEYTRRLEEQTMELERAHSQTRTFCGIVQEVGALRSLNEIGFFLIKTLEGILKCGHMVLLFFDSDRNVLFAVSPDSMSPLKEPETIQKAATVLEGLTKVTFTEKMALTPPLVPKSFQEADRQAIVPLEHENQLFGALVIACPGECQCDLGEVDTIRLMLENAAGVIKRAISQEQEVLNLRTRMETSAEFSGIIGRDPKMHDIYRLIEDIAPTDASVLIEGESGTGKELVARAIHEQGLRKTKPFIIINCSAYPATLLESELFGHEKGAFTGAIRQKAGRFELAHGGTVFLDEVGEIPPSAQIKLLRVLQDQKFERLGGEKTLEVDVRILAATNKDLLEEVKNGDFREDLFYRLKVIPIHLPPLKQRQNDIPLLARHFLQRFALDQKKKIQDISSDAMRLLLDYPWPGNVRELENTIEHATVLAKDERLEASDFPNTLRSSDGYEISFGQSNLAEHEKGLLVNVLEECGWNKKEAARRLGISRNTLYGKIKRHLINKPTTH